MSGCACGTDRDGVEEVDRKSRPMIFRSLLLMVFVGGGWAFAGFPLPGKKKNKDQPAAAEPAQVVEAGPKAPPLFPEGLPVAFTVALHFGVDSTGTRTGPVVIDGNDVASRTGNRIQAAVDVAGGRAATRGCPSSRQGSRLLRCTGPSHANNC